MNPLRVGVIGCGNISGIYLENLTRFPKTTVVAVADLARDKAEETARNCMVRAMSPEELLADEEVELVLNLTVPLAHAQVSNAAIRAGKHVYVEKPLGIYREDGVRTLMLLGEANANRRLLLGAAPDTFMGAAHQACRAIIDSGAIGEPIGCNAFMVGHGPEGWHPNPEFYYQVGGGPLFDMGPYYLTALVNMLGPVKRVAGMATKSFKERVIGSEAKRGAIIPVETPTHIIGTLEFESGAIGQLTTSFDVWHSNLANIEVYGTEGSMLVPDPNGFGGPVYVRKANDSEWEEVAVTRPYSQNSRGIAVLDMAYAIRTGRPHRASSSLAFHVLDIMQSILDAAKERRTLEMTSIAERPAALAATGPEDDLDG